VAREVNDYQANKGGQLPATMTPFTPATALYSQTADLPDGLSALDSRRADDESLAACAIYSIHRAP